MGSETRLFVRGARLLLSSKTVEAKFLMVPDRPEVNWTIAGIVGRAQKKYGVVIHGVVFMSNHFHVHVTGDTPEQIANFMRDVKSGIALAINRLRGRSGVFWGERYHLQESSGEDEADVGQLSYVLGHGAKEGLVAEPGDWTGVSSARELLGGGAVTSGVWVDRAALARTTAAKAAREPEAFERGYQIRLTPLPGLEGKGEAARREVLRGAVAEVIESERERNGVARVVTRRTPLLPDWDQRPKDLLRSKAAQKRQLERQRNSWRFRRSMRAVRASALAELAERRRRIARLHAVASVEFRARRPADFPEFTFPPGLPMAGAGGLHVPGSRRRNSARRLPAPVT